MATIRIFSIYLRVPYLLLAFTEALVFFLSVYGAVLIRYSTLDLNDPIILSANLGTLTFRAMLFTLSITFAMTAMGQYHTQQYMTPSHIRVTLIKILFSIAFGTFTLMILYYLFPLLYIGRGVTAIALGLSLVGVVIIREFFYLMLDGNVLRQRILVLGAGHKAAELIGSSNGEIDGRSYQLVGFLETACEKVMVDDKYLIKDDLDLESLISKYRIDEVVFAVDDRRSNCPSESLLNCKMSGISITDPITFLEREQGKVNLHLFQPSWMIFSDGCQHGQIEELTGRAFDVVASLLIVTLVSPILLLAAFLVGLEGGFRHPIFYRQTRVGLNGTSFELLKFRSMKTDAEVDGKAVWASQNDNRITLIGRFMRKTRIDELPQALNILKGDMRLIGPRPERPEFVTQLNREFPMYCQRHTVKPGLAGWAQLRYPYGATINDAYEKLQYDLYYIKNHNLIMDFFILVQTIEIVVFGKGAR